MKENFWENKKVFVAGGTGFVGSWLVKELADKGAHVFCLIDNLKEKSNFLEWELNRKTKLIFGDISNLRLIKDCLEQNKIEYVFHLAAQSTEEKCLKYPLSAIEANILGTANLLEACREVNSIKSVICASSTRVYSSSEETPYEENSKLEAINSIYSSSKMCADFLAQTYGRVFKLPICSARFSYMYGGGDFNFSRIVPETIKKILFEEEIVIRCDGKFKICPLYVKDSVNALLLLAEQIEKEKICGESFNIAGEPVLLLDLVKKIIAVSGRNPKLNVGEGEVKDKNASSKKAETILNWRPQYNLEEGLKETFKWYEKYFKINEEN